MYSRVVLQVAPETVDTVIRGNASQTFSMTEALDTLATHFGNILALDSLVQMYLTRVVVTVFKVEPTAATLTWPLPGAPIYALNDSVTNCTRAPTVDAFECESHAGAAVVPSVEHIAFPSLRGVCAGVSTTEVNVIRYASDKLFGGATNVLPVVSSVLAVTVGCREGSIALGSNNPIEFSFPISPGAVNVSCQFWMEATSAWNASGCVTVNDGHESLQTCRCDHLTSFGVVSNFGTTESESQRSYEHELALTLILYIGAACSIVCLVAVVVLYAMFPKARNIDKRILQQLSVAYAAMLGMFLIATAK